MPSLPPLFVVGDGGSSQDYRGSCHCGSVQFSLPGPRLATTSNPEGYKPVYCTCTLCIKQGWWLVYVSRNKVTFNCTDDELKEKLGEYKRKDGRSGLPVRFCNVCGTSLMLDTIGVIGKDELDLLCLNVKTFQDVIFKDVLLADSPNSQKDAQGS